MSEASPQELLELQQALYQSGNPTRRWLHVTRRDWIFDAIRRHRGADRALEVGPGSGVYLPVLAEAANTVVAADIEDAYLTHARALTATLPGLSVVQDDITATLLPYDAFQLVLCTEVIEHVADSSAALAGLAKALAPDGVLILSTPQRFSPLELCAKVAFLPGIIQLVRLVYREPIIPTGHINLLTESALRAQIEEAGLVTIERYKSGFYLPLVAEFGGASGQRLLAWCEEKLRGSPLSWLLWTQYYVLRKHGQSDAG